MTGYQGLRNGMARPTLVPMSRNHKRPTEPATASSQSAISNAEAPADAVRRASTNERYGHAALFATAACVLGTLALLVGQLGWWTLVLGPAYLAAVSVATIVARGRANTLLAVALATASTGIVVALIKLTGLA
jgi:hypothetical protein